MSDRSAGVPPSSHNRPPNVRPNVQANALWRQSREYRETTYVSVQDGLDDRLQRQQRQKWWMRSQMLIVLPPR
jgi:hypothetical protein